MGESGQRAGLGPPRERLGRLLVVGLLVVILVNLVLFVREQRGDRRLRLRAATDLEALAVRSPSKAVRSRHATYYRLARDLHGVTLFMDGGMAAQHGWALRGLGDVDVRVSRQRHMRIAGSKARPLIAAASYSTRLDQHKLHVLLEPGAIEYVLALAGKGDKAPALILPRARFAAARGQ